MPAHSLIVGPHRIDLWCSWWNGKESVSVDGKIVSEKRSFRLVSTHSFTLQDDDGPASYQVNIGSGAGAVIRKDGEIVAAHHRRILRYFMGVGFIYIAFWIVGHAITLGLRMMDLSLAATVQQYMPAYDGLAGLIGGFPFSLWMKKRMESPPPITPG